MYQRGPRDFNAVVAEVKSVLGSEARDGDTKNALTRCGFNTERTVAPLLDWIEKGRKGPTGPFEAFNGAEAAVLTRGKEEEGQ